MNEHVTKRELNEALQKQTQHILGTLGDYVTRVDLGEAIEKQVRQTQSALDKAMEKQTERILGVMSDFSNQTNQRFDQMEAKFDSLLDVTDGHTKQIETLGQEQAIIKRQLTNAAKVIKAEHEVEIGVI